MAPGAPLYLSGLFLSPSNAKRIARYALPLVALGAILFSPSAHGANQARQSAGKSVQTQRPAPRATHVVTDEMGRKIRVPLRVERIVSLAPNDTDILYSLGAAKKITAVTDFTVTPPGQPKKPSVGQPLEPSLEEIVSLKPDVVLAARSINRQQTVESLDRLGIPVYMTDANSIEQMFHSVQQIADLIGMKTAGEKVVGRMKKRLNALRARLAGLPPTRVLFVVWDEPLITTGENTFIADALRWADARSVIRLQQDWPQISLEEVMRLQPAVLIFSAFNGGTPTAIERSLRHREGWRELKAVREDRVIVVGDAINRASPDLVGAIEQLARQLHPAAFSSTRSSPASRATRVATRGATRPEGR